jgi:hypothetical protein
MNENESKPIITSWGGNGQMTISGICKEDQERVTASFKAGAYWLRVKDKMLEIKPSWEPLPDPVKDPKMFPFWREPAEGEVKTQTKLFEIEKEGLDYHNSPSISIQHLCGFKYTDKGYKFNAEQLESYGFECMRSRRGLDGKYWEIWFLPGLWAAKGELKEIVGHEKGKKTLEKALEFITRHVQFGSLDISVQRLAMVLE